jgi:AraC-like DNA-binding protein
VRLDAADAHAPDLATLAYDLGYADQPHLTREVRALAGVTPSELLRLRRT